MVTYQGEAGGLSLCMCDCPVSCCPDPDRKGSMTQIFRKQRPQQPKDHFVESPASGVNQEVLWRSNEK